MEELDVEKMWDLYPPYIQEQSIGVLTLIDLGEKTTDYEIGFN